MKTGEMQHCGAGKAVRSRSETKQLVLRAAAFKLEPETCTETGRKSLRFLSENPITLGRLTEFDTKLTLISIHRLLDSFNREHGTGLRLIRHDLAAELVRELGVYHNTRGGVFLTKSSPFVTDALIAYERPGKRFGDEIVSPYFPRLIVPTGSFKGERDAAILLTGISMDDLKTGSKETKVEAPDSKITLVKPFPGRSAEFFYRCGHVLNLGKPSAGSSFPEISLERAEGEWVGPIVRTVEMRPNGGWWGMRRLIANQEAGSRFHALVEMSEEDERILGAGPLGAETMMRRIAELGSDITGAGSSPEILEMRALWEEANRIGSALQGKTGKGRG